MGAFLLKSYTFQNGPRRCKNFGYFWNKIFDENFQKGSPNLVTLPPIVPMLFFYFFAAHKSWQKFESRFWTIDESAVCKASDKLVTVQICFL